ncbi:MAG TPA: NADH-quinone oxidoreductase subunit J [Lacipirellula sp.]
MTESVRQVVMLAAIAASAAGLWLATSPRAARALRMLGGLVASAGLMAAVFALYQAVGTPRELADEAMFWFFAGLAIISSVFMITTREPVYAALWFALATLGACGLFMLVGAPFLAAATIIVYAGAIIVTFLFVIMLSQQQGRSFYDQRARTPVMSIVASLLLLGAMLWSYQRWDAPERAAGGPALTAEAGSNPLSQAPDDDAFHTMRSLGRSLFGDYLYAIEIAGALLLIAGIGAIAIAPRRAEGTL